MSLTTAQARAMPQSFRYWTKFVAKKLFTQVGSHKRKDIMLLTQSFEERDHLIEADPGTFYITDHFKNYKGLLARIDRLDAMTFRALTAALRYARYMRRSIPRRVRKFFA